MLKRYWLFVDDDLIDSYDSFEEAEKTFNDFAPVKNDMHGKIFDAGKKTTKELSLIKVNID